MAVCRALLQLSLVLMIKARCICSKSTPKTPLKVVIHCRLRATAPVQPSGPFIAKGRTGALLEEAGSQGLSLLR